MPEGYESVPLTGRRACVDAWWHAGTGLEPRPDARPTPAALQEALGDYERMRTHFDEPRQLLFSSVHQTGPWHVVVLAEVDSTAELEHAPVQRLTFRRDAP